MIIHGTRFSWLIWCFFASSSLLLTVIPPLLLISVTENFTFLFSASAPTMLWSSCKKFIVADVHEAVQENDCRNQNTDHCKTWTGRQYVPAGRRMSMSRSYWSTPQGVHRRWVGDIRCRLWANEWRLLNLNSTCTFRSFLHNYYYHHYSRQETDTSDCGSRWLALEDLIKHHNMISIQCSRN